MNLPPSATLKRVEYNRPSVTRSPSKQSQTASDGYNSISGTTSSNRSKVTIVPYQTPPSRNISPSNLVDEASQLQQQPAMAQPIAPQTPVRQNLATQNREPRSSNNAPNERNGETESLISAVDDTPHVRFALNQLTREGSSSPEFEDYPDEHGSPLRGRGFYPFAPKQQQQQQDETRKEQQQQSQPRSPPETGFLTPADPPGDRSGYPSLDFVPLPLRWVSLGALLVLCLAMIAGLAFCTIWSQRHGGIWDYDRFGGSRYFVSQYLPQILAVVLVIWTFVVQAAVYRITPLCALAKSQSQDRVLQDMPMLPRNFILPDLSHFKSGESLVGACLFVLWVTNVFAIPLQSCLFQVRFYGPSSTGGFRWTAVEGVAWTLVGLYALLALAIAGVIARFSRTPTGLMWDPVSIADLIPLIQRSNVLSEFDQSEVSLHVGRHIALPPLRLGYWHGSASSGILYGIGAEGKSQDQAIDIGHSRENSAESSVLGEDVEQQCLNGKNSFEKAIVSPWSRHRWAPWFLRDTFVVTWIVLVAVLTTALVVVSFVKQPLLKGFLPLLPTSPSETGFSSSNFLFSFIPALIGTFFFLAWQPVDVYFRALQSYVDLSARNGAAPETSILLRYNSRLPLEVTFAALVAGHYKVAYISFISVASSVLPILAGGVFLGRYYSGDHEIRISTHFPAYYTLIAFVILYSLSVFVIWPCRKRYLPHSLVTYADAISFLYRSPLLSDPVLREPSTREDLITRLIAPPPGRAGTSTYSFGVYRGNDGREHLGIDRASLSGKLEMMTAGRGLSGS